MSLMLIQLLAPSTVTYAKLHLMEVVFWVFSFLHFQNKCRDGTMIMNIICSAMKKSRAIKKEQKLGVTNKNLNFSKMHIYFMLNNFGWMLNLTSLKASQILSNTIDWFGNEIFSENLLFRHSRLTPREKSSEYKVQEWQKLGCHFNWHFHLFPSILCKSHRHFWCWLYSCCWFFNNC